MRERHTRSRWRLRRARLVLLLPLLGVLVACGCDSGGPPPAPAETANPLLAAVDRSDWEARERDAGFRALPDRAGIELVFLGDSLIQRFERSGRQVWQQYYGERRAANFGVDGDRVQNLLARLNRGLLRGMRPRLVVLLIGTNNSAEASPEQVAEGILAIVDELRRRLPDTRVLVVGLLPKGALASSPARAALAPINAALKRAADSDFVHFVDVGASFTEPDGSLSLELMPDQLHPSAAGYAVLARALEPAISALLR